MLVLSRKAGEKILIGDKISVTVVRIGPGIVRIGVEAPQEMAVLREELTKAANDENASLRWANVEPVTALADDSGNPPK